MENKSKWVNVFSDSVVMHIGQSFSPKDVTIKELREEGQLTDVYLEIATRDDPFDTFNVTISQSDFENNFQKEQQLRSNFDGFGILMAGIFKNIRDPRQKYNAHLEVISPKKSKLTITYTTPLKYSKELEVELTLVTNDDLKNIVLATMGKLEAKLQESEKIREELSKELKEVKFQNSAHDMNFQETYLKAMKWQEEKVKEMNMQYAQKLEELEKINLENFNNYKNEVKDGMRMLKITNNSLQVLNKILETENFLIKKTLWKESKELRSANKAKEQVDKDIKILKTKITKCNMEMNDNHTHINHLKIENDQLKKKIEEYTRLMANLTATLCEVKRLYESNLKLNEECAIANQEVLLRLDIVKLEKKVVNDKLLLIQERNQDLEQAQIDLKNKINIFEKKAKEDSDKMNKCKNDLIAKHRELEMLSAKLRRLEEELKAIKSAADSHTVSPMEVSDAVEAQESHDNTDENSVGNYLQTKFVAVVRARQD